MTSTGLSKLDYTARDFTTIKAELSDYVLATEPLLWTDFFESNLGVLLIDFVSYIGDINSFTIDRVSEEIFPVTATQRNSLIKFGRSVAYTPQGSSPASVEVTVDQTTIGAAFTSQGLAFNKGITFAGGGVTFELIQDEYFTAATDPVTLEFTAGLTSSEVFAADGRQWQEYTIETPSIINDSWKVFVDTVEWTLVDALLLSEATQVYEVVYEDNGYITVRFGDGFNGVIPQISSVIQIEYRYGGGISGNVEAKSIDARINGIFDDATVTNVRVFNENRASGGADEESNEHIKRWLPGWVKTNSRAVSVEDYVTLINTYTDPVYGKPHRATARLRVSGWGSIVEGIYDETYNMPDVVIKDYECLGVGNGTVLSFTYTTQERPIIPNTVRIDAIVDVNSVATDAMIRDDGNGFLVCDYIIGGSVDYANGIIQVSFRTGNPPTTGEVLSLYYENSPLTLTGVNKTDESIILGVGNGVATVFTGTVPGTLLLPNEDADDPAIANLTDFGVRLHTVVVNAGVDVPLALYDGVLNTGIINMTGQFREQVGGGVSPEVFSSVIDYNAGTITITFISPVKDGEGVYLYYTKEAYNWDQGDGVTVAFTGTVGEAVVPGTLRFFCTVGGNSVWIRDKYAIGVWSMWVVNIAGGATPIIAASTINHATGSVSFTLSAAPDNLTPIIVAYREVAPATDLPYGALTFVRGIVDSTLGGLENSGMYQWLTNQWYLLMDKNASPYALPANVVDIWLWSKDSRGYLSTVSDTLISGVLDYLVDISIATVQLNVESGKMLPFLVDLDTVYYTPKYDVNTIRADIQTALMDLITSDDRYPGDSLSVSTIYNAVYGVEGVLGFQIKSPLNSIQLNRDEMAVFGKVERLDTGIVGTAATQVLDYGGAAAVVFGGALVGVAANNIVNTSLSVTVETWIDSGSGIERSSVSSEKLVPPIGTDMGFTNQVGAFLDTALVNSYVDYTTGVIQLTYLFPPETHAEIVVTYWQEEFTVEGELLYTPITGTTVLFEMGDIFITDDGSGNLVSNEVSGTIDYDTGVYSMVFDNSANLTIPPPVDGESLLASFNYSFRADFVPLIQGEVADKTGYSPDWTCPS